MGSKFLRQDSEMTLPRGSVSDLPFSLKKSWELACPRTARSLLQTLPKKTISEPFVRQVPGPNFCSPVRENRMLFRIQGAFPGDFQEALKGDILKGDF